MEPTQTSPQSKLETKTFTSLLNTWVDLSTYPIHDLNNENGKRFISECRSQLIFNGACVLDGFLTPKAIQMFTKQTANLLPLAFHKKVTGNAYLEAAVDESLPLDHPKRHNEATSLAVIAYDQIPKSDGIYQLYQWNRMTQFISQVFEGKPIFHYADPLGAINISVMKDGDTLGWHFDQTDFVVSIALQDSEQGGDFEYSPFIRSATAENYSDVASVLKGTSLSIHHLPMRAGSFVLFEGRNSIHRVTEIKGQTPRLVALYGYDTQPGRMSSEHLRYIRYGRSN